MNVAHDQNTFVTGHPQGYSDNDAFANSGADSSGLPIDWCALRLRLFAAHEARTALAADGAPPRLRLRGSFDGCAASVLITYEALQTGVNPTVSIYRKPREDNVSPVVGTSTTGGRG